MFIPQGWRLDLVGIDPAEQWAVMRDLAAYADSRDAWDSLWVYDHFHTVPVPTAEATHEAWSLMSAFAATTSRIKLGQMCTAMSYRNPVYLAKVAATADVISGGRIQMGIGGGWYEHEWRAYGYGFPSAGVRLGRLDEGVQIMRAAWRDGVVTFEGKHYQADGATVQPKPLQANSIPLWIAGGGEKVTLRIAARHADGWNIAFVPPEVLRHKNEVLDRHCDAVGRDGTQIERTVNVALAWNEDDLVAQFGDAAPYIASSALKGSTQEVVDQVAAYRDAGAEWVILALRAPFDTEGLDRFAEEVLPAFA